MSLCKAVITVLTCYVARAAIYSNLHRYREEDVRYDRDVLFGLHNVNMKSHRDMVRGKRVAERQEREISRLLDTTERQLKWEHRKKDQTSDRKASRCKWSV